MTHEKTTEAKRRRAHQWTIHAVIILERQVTTPLDSKAREPHTLATYASKKPMAAAMPPITGINSTSTDTTQISAGKKAIWHTR